MKFILNEDKFILTETPHFLLDERFILIEATAAEITQKWSIQLVKTFDNTEAVLKKYLEYANISAGKAATKSRLDGWAQKFKDAAEEFEVALRQPLADLNGDIATAKTQLTSCVEVLKEVTTTVDETPENKATLSSLKKLIELFDKFNSTSSWTAANVTKLKQALEKATELGKTFFDASGLDADLSKVQDFKTDCSKCLELLTELKTKLPVDFDFTKVSTDDLTIFQRTAKQLIDSVQLKDAAALNKGLIIANFKVYWEQVKLLKSGYTTLVELPSLNPVDTKIETDSTAPGGKDWKAKLAKAAKKDTVIQEFIYTTWPEEASHVLRIKDTILSEVEAYGFEVEGSTQNPFISFISNIYLKYKGLVTVEKYNTIHNLVANNLLTGEDLLGNGDMGFGNIVFCKALYSLDPSVIKLYVKKQHNLLKAATKDSRFKTNAEMAFNALYNLTEIATGEATKTSEALSIRPMNEVEQLESKWTGQVSDTAEKPAKNKIANNAELIKQIDTSENAIKVLAALAVKFSSNDKITAAAQSCKEARELMSKTTTLEDIRKLVASVERLYKIESITTSQALSLIKSILEADQFTLTLE